jgi:hypothetical protein
MERCNYSMFNTCSNWINEPERPEMYDNIQKYCATFHSGHTVFRTCCCEFKNSGKWRSLESENKNDEVKTADML